MEESPTLGSLENIVIRQKLPPDREEAANLYVSHNLSQRKIAKRINRHHMTVYNWFKDPDFQNRIKELRVSTEEQALEIIQEGLIAAVKTITDAAAGNLEVEAKELAPRLKAALWIAEFLKEKKLPQPGQPGKRTNLKPPMSSEEERDLLDA